MRGCRTGLTADPTYFCEVEHSAYVSGRLDTHKHKPRSIGANREVDRMLLSNPGEMRIQHH